MIASVVLAIAIGQTVDPYRLPIGAPGEVMARPGEIVATATGRVVSVDELAAAADPVRWVYLGETHTNAAHHRMQAAVIEALVSRGRNVAVGLEMFTWPAQENLDPWSLGWWTEEEFIERSGWRTQWNMDFALYRPIFESVRRHRLPMVALNVPREWVRTVGREGLDALTAEQRAALPEEIDLNRTHHRQVFQSLIGGHPMGDRGETMYAAQVVWDVGMAHAARRFMDARRRPREAVFVVIAGSGHVMYNEGINARIGEPGLNLVMIAGSEPRPVARGIADFVYMARE